MKAKQAIVLIEELNKPEYVSLLDEGAYEEIADSFNFRQAIPNPDPQPQRSVLPSWAMFFSLMNGDDILKLYGYGNLATDLRTALRDQDYDVALPIWNAIKSVLSKTSVNAIDAELEKTEPDPSWTATLLRPSLAMTLGLPLVTTEDVQTAHHRMQK